MKNIISDPQHFAKIAILLGLLVIGGCLLISWYSYSASEKLILNHIFESNMKQAQFFSKYANSLKNQLPQKKILNTLENTWKKTYPHSKGQYLCVVLSKGTLALHTAANDLVGKNVGKMPVTMAPKTSKS